MARREVSCIAYAVASVVAVASLAGIASADVNSRWSVPFGDLPFDLPGAAKRTDYYVAGQQLEVGTQDGRLFEYDFATELWTSKALFAAAMHVACGASASPP